MMLAVADAKSQPRRRNAKRGTPKSLTLEQKIIQLVTKRPLDKVELSKALNMPAHERPKLRDLLRAMETRGELARVRRDRYVLPQQADLCTGVIHFHPSGSARLVCDQEGEGEIWISAENTWTAMHGDRVVARLISESGPSEWQPGRPDRREGRVIRILQRANETVVGTLQKSKNFFYVVADDPRFVNNLYVPAPRPPLQAKPGDKVVARLEDWPSRHVNPEGSLVEVLGAADAPGVDMLSIIRKYRLALQFPTEVEKEASRISTTVEAREIENRQDLRDRFVITIDPDDARDFDDAIEVIPHGDGWRAWIHIADVSHYVRPKSALDREALARGNSTYLADRVIPMLPESLSNGICSLKPGVERLAFTVIADISKRGRISSTRFAKTVIKSKHRLTYRQALERLQKAQPEDELDERLHTAWQLSSLLRRNRFAHGSLDLDFPEVKVWLDENGKPVRLEKVENDISHQLIEELMLLANECVARELKNKQQPTMYRVHENPDPDKLVEYRDLVMSHGVKIGDLGQRGEIQKLLRTIRGESFEYAIKIGLLKSLKRARYAADPLGHYGLAKADYLHFTSPIRRYADLVAHRSLERHLGLTKYALGPADLASTAEHISTTERISMDAERESVKLKKLEYFQSQIQERQGHAFEARIVEVKNFGLFVELPEFLLSGLIHVSVLEGDFFHFDPARSRLVGRRTKKVYQAGDTLSVIVARVDMFKQQVDFKPVTEQGAKREPKRRRR